VTERLRALPCNSWFIDCDAFGELFDDYSPLHPATQEEDMQARLARMAWIRDTHGLVVGSEGGSAYAAATIHFAHGMMTPPFGYGDPELRDHESPYFLGGYYPPESPTLFMRPVPIKRRFADLFYDPRYRLPLYQTVFHDSVVTTHHWERGSLKFPDTAPTVELLELLYNVPPLYHLNQQEFARHRRRITAHHSYFSTLHRRTGTLPMTAFEWLSPDHMVQKTVFGGKIEMIANFAVTEFRDRGVTLPPRSILTRDGDRGRIRVYTARENLPERAP
jgi:hypothetical protein